MPYVSSKNGGVAAAPGQPHVRESGREQERACFNERRFAAGPIGHGASWCRPFQDTCSAFHGAGEIAANIEGALHAAADGLGEPYRAVSDIGAGTRTQHNWALKYENAGATFVVHVGSV